jgi:hypothetical protein
MISISADSLMQRACAIQNATGTIKHMTKGIMSHPLEPLKINVALS